MNKGKTVIVSLITLFVCALLALAGVIVKVGQSEAALVSPDRPVPLSEYCEQTGPNTVVYLTYPKYYRLPDRSLRPVQTHFVESKLENWDYEVTTGIWKLYVRKDGVFQAVHQSDVFAYALYDVGIGTGQSFQSLDLGEPNWENCAVVGDRVVWTDIFPKIDLTVRYIHDTLKVDVLVREERVQELIAEKDGAAAGDYLTARFAIPYTLLRSEAVQGGQPRNLYADAVHADAPLLFKRGEKIVHALRPAVAYTQDSQGQRIGQKGEPSRLRTAQQWRLAQDGVGVADISVSLQDVASAPKGDLLIDPSTSFYPSSDTRLKTGSATNYGSNTSLYWEDDDRLLFSFDVDSFPLQVDRWVESATLKIYANESELSGDEKGRLYPVTTWWEESEANWDEYETGEDWDTEGGDFDSDCVGESTALPQYPDYNIWVELDATAPLNYQLRQSDWASKCNNYGFLAEIDTTEDDGYLCIWSVEYGTVSKRPKLEVTLNNTKHGADAGNGWDYDNWTVDSRQDGIKADNMEMIRFFVGGSGEVATAVEVADTNGMKLDLVFNIPFHATPVPTETAIAYAVDSIIDILDNHSAEMGDTIFAVEIGNEEDTFHPTNWGLPSNSTQQYYPRDPNYWFLNATPGGTPVGDPVIDPRAERKDGLTYQQIALECYASGEAFSEFYLPIRDAIKENWPDVKIISGGSTYSGFSLNYPDAPLQHFGGGPTATPDPRITGLGQRAGAFLCGFIDGVTAQATVNPTPGVSAFERLPEVFAEHDYAQWEPPEKSSEYYLRLEKMDERIDSWARGRWRPEYANTEWAVDYWHAERPATLPTEAEFTPRINAPDRQALHYIRATLMDATLRTEDRTRGWDYSLYFHHPKSPLNHHSMYEFVATNVAPAAPGTPRPIRKVARTLYSPEETPYPGLNQEDMRVWHPAETTPAPAVTDGWMDLVNTRPMQCGWVSPSGEHWGAIWMFKGITGTNPDTNTWNYYEATPQAKTFAFDEDDFDLQGGDIADMEVQLYKFEDLDSYADVSLNAIGTPLTGSSSGGVMSYDIPDVDHNPTFLRFIPEY